MGEAPVESSPQIPALSKESWELIQYRLWDSVRSKMWTTLTAFLTLVTIAGLLGIPRYISWRIDEKVTGEVAKFEQLRAEIEAERVTLLTRSSLASHLAFVWAQDLAQLQRLLLEVLAELDAPRFNKDEDARDVKLSVRLLSNRLLRYDLAGGEFCSEVRLLTDVLGQGSLPEVPHEYSEEPLSSEDWSEFVSASSKWNLRQLPGLYALYSHTFALRSAMATSYQLMIDPSLTDGSRKANLYHEYNEEIYPLYHQSLDELYGESGPPPPAPAGVWSWLPETALVAFFQQEQRLVNSSRRGSEEASSPNQPAGADG